MATIERRKGKNGTSYTARIVKKRGGKVIHKEAKTFPRKAMAEAWAKAREAELDEQLAFGRTTNSGMSVGEALKEYLIWCDTASDLRRTKREVLTLLQSKPIAGLEVSKLSSTDILDHLKRRRFEDGAGPATVLQDMIYLRNTMRYIAGHTKVFVPLNEVEAAVQAAYDTGLVGRAAQRERRVSDAEIDALVNYFREKRQRRKNAMPMDDIILFALHSARRASEITRLLWSDLDRETYTCVVRDAKHPRKTTGNHRRFKLTREAMEIINRQPTIDDRIFPYKAKTISSIFPRACHALGIKDLRFHDLRHEATSRLFEKGYSIVEVQQFTLHESWAVLKRYTHLRPEDVELRD